jgi:hypothetical protein
MMKENSLRKLEAFGQSIWHGGCGGARWTRMEANGMKLNGRGRHRNDTCRHDQFEL